MSEDIIYHKFCLDNQTTFTENNQQAQWGNWYWATEKLVSKECYFRIFELYKFTMEALGINF